MRSFTRRKSASFFATRCCLESTLAPILRDLDADETILGDDLEDVHWKIGG
jgi:TnpA family transposase